MSVGCVQKQSDINRPCVIVSGADRESHEDAITTEITEELQPAKVPLLPKDIVNSKKVHAVRKEKKRILGKQRNMGTSMDYSPLPIDKREPEFVSLNISDGDDPEWWHLKDNNGSCRMSCNDCVASS